ncbi:MAG: alkylphosphonate utilization protein [Pantoea sp.]|nr:alkylphosphonate utilization protein [Pantoea sp.]
MQTLPSCPECHSEYTWQDGDALNCPECGHIWSQQAMDAAQDEGLVVRDVNGTQLADGDSVTVVKDLKVKGSSSALKIGTKVKRAKPQRTITHPRIKRRSVSRFAALRMLAEQHINGVALRFIQGAAAIARQRRHIAKFT